MIVPFLLALASAGPYRVTLDVARADVESRRDFQIAVGGVRIDTAGTRLLHSDPDATLRAVSSVSRTFEHGRRYAVADAGAPARFSITTQIPYTTRTVRLSDHFAFTTNEVGTTEVGSILAVTVAPAGGDQVTVQIEASESRAGDRISSYGLEGWAPPPTVTGQRILTQVTIPLGATLYLGGAPGSSATTNDAFGGEASYDRDPFAELLFGGRGEKDRSQENLMLLTVQEERPMNEFDAADLIRQMIRRRREDW